METQKCFSCPQSGSCICDCRKHSFCDSCFGWHVNSNPDYFHFPVPTELPPGPNLKDYLSRINEEILKKIQEKNKKINDFILKTISQLNTLKSLALKEESEMQTILLATFTGQGNKEDMERLKNFVKKRKFSYSAIETDEIEKNISEMKKELIKSIKGLEEHSFCYQCGKLSELIKLECKHLLCRSCFEGLVRNQTDSKFVLNVFEQKDIICIYENCSYKISDSIQEKNIYNYDFYKKQAEDRINFTCKKCQVRGKLDVFQMSCHHYCEECTVNQIRSKQLTCPDCTKPFSPKELNLFLSKKKKCDGCLESFLWIKDFPERQCDHFLHEECLNECMIQNNKNCFIGKNCKEFQKSLKDLFEFKCEKCNFYFSKTTGFWFSKNCSCNICDECQLNFSNENTKECLICQSEFNAITQNILEEKVHFRNLEIKTCKICYEKVKMKNLVNTSTCDHDFCRICINSHVKACLGDMSMMPKLNKCMFCQEEYSNSQLESIIGAEAVTRLLFFILQTKKIELSDCPKCKFKFEAASRKAICPSCNAEFCKQCNEDFHDQGGCEEAFLQQRIMDMERDGEEVCQCPRCRFPYYKDENCDHVICMQAHCQVHFCFICGCLRSPTMEHGNHYHRKECKHYAPILEEYREINKDKGQEKCIECQRLGFKHLGDDHCKPPKSLRRVRRVDPDEVE